MWVPVVGTLLGPEGAGCPAVAGGALLLSGPVCSSYHQLRCLVCPSWGLPRGVLGWRGRVAGVWLYVENCTVDASIFLTLQLQGLCR